MLKMHSGRLRWFGHAQRRDANNGHPQTDGAGITRYQMTRTSQEDMAPADQGRYDGRGCYPGYGPRLEGVEKKDKADP